MNVLHLQLSGGIGGISILLRDINKISKVNNYFYFIFEGGCIADEIKKDGATVFVANDKNSSYLKGSKHLVKFCKKNNIDIVVDHTGSPVTRFYHAYAAGKLKNTKFIMYLHSNASDAHYNNKAKDFVWKKIFFSAYRHSDALVAISNSVKESYVNIFGLDKNKINVVFNGIDINKFYKASTDDSVFKLLYVGRIFKEKGISVLINAISMLENKNNIHLDLVGSDHGGYTEKMKLLAKQKGVDNIITFHGLQNNVPDFLANADAFVHPSIGDEGFGIAIVEALASSLPCIAFNKGALSELIQNGYNGFLIEDVNANSLKNQIESCIELFCQQQWKKYQENAKLSAKKYTIEQTNNNLEKIYAKVTE